MGWLQSDTDQQRPFWGRAMLRQSHNEAYEPRGSIMTSLARSLQVSRVATQFPMQTWNSGPLQKGRDPVRSQMSNCRRLQEAVRKLLVLGIFFQLFLLCV